jgi:hypothetical protein
MWKVRPLSFYWFPPSFGFLNRDADGPHYFLPIRGTSVKSAFGCDVKDSELESDSYGRAPPALVALARRLQDSQGGCYISSCPILLCC